MYKLNPRLSDWPWLEERINEINEIPFPESSWTPDQHEEYLALMDEPEYRSRRIDRQNLERLIEIASFRSDAEVFHVLRDTLAVIVTPEGELVLFNEGLIRRIINAKVPFDRLRSCPGCRSIFWMKTKRSQTCGNKACADALGNKKRAKKR